MNAKQALHAAAAVLDALPLIASMTHVGGDKAPAALASIGAALGALSDGLTGAARPEDVLAKIAKLRAALASNDAAADAALKAKFAKPDPVATQLPGQGERIK